MTSSYGADAIKTRRCTVDSRYFYSTDVYDLACARNVSEYWLSKAFVQCYHEQKQWWLLL